MEQISVEQLHTVQPETPSLSSVEVVRAATNDPSLAADKFQLGDTVFPVLDLAYDDYIAFLARLQPVLEGLASKGLGIHAVSDFTVASLIKYCANDLPEMVRIAAKQTDPTITVEDVKRLGKTPFKLATIVLKQVQQNKMISEIADFFAQILPLLKAGADLKSTTATTH